MSWLTGESIQAYVHEYHLNGARDWLPNWDLDNSLPTYLEVDLEESLDISEQNLQFSLEFMQESVEDTLLLRRQFT